MIRDVWVETPRWEAGRDAMIFSAAIRLTHAPHASWAAACQWLHSREDFAELQLALYASRSDQAMLVMAVRGDPVHGDDPPLMLFERALAAGLAACLGGRA